VTAEALGLTGIGLLVLGASLGVVLARNLFHSVLWLALALVGTAGLFVLLHAEFLAAVQVLLYAGGVVTIVVFAIMLTERLVGDSLRQTNRGLAAGAAAAAAVFLGLAATILRGTRGTAPGPAPDLTTAALGRAVLTEWVLAFEVLGVLLVAALLGAVYLARTEE
jgi:NADH-quinone oxidoreductase subunit J